MEKEEEIGPVRGGRCSRDGCCGEDTQSPCNNGVFYSVKSLDEELLTREQPDPVGEIWRVMTDGQKDRKRSMLMKDGMN